MFEILFGTSLRTDMPDERDCRPKWSCTCVCRLPATYLPPELLGVSRVAKVPNTSDVWKYI